MRTAAASRLHALSIDPDDIPDAQPATGPRIDAFPIRFTGDGASFLRLWLVNTALRIVTLGFYTPFARRKTVQYFFGHTVVAGSPLEFVAPKKRMLFGFVMMVLLLISWKIAVESGQDTAASLFVLGGALLAPWAWGSAMRFRMTATRWRGVRMQFAATWGEVYRASWPIFLIALAWIAFVFAVDHAIPDTPPGSPPRMPVKPSWDALAFPLGALAVALLTSLFAGARLDYNYQALAVARCRVGNQAGRWKLRYADFVGLWLATVGVLLLGVAAALGVFFATGAAAVFGLRAGGPSTGGLAFVVLILLGLVVGGLLLVLSSAPARAYREARRFRMIWNQIGLSHIARCKCRLDVGRYVRLRLVNLVLTLITLGFYLPYARISEYRMRAESVTLFVKGGLHQLAGQLAREEQGLGDALADAAGLGLIT